MLAKRNIGKAKSNDFGTIPIFHKENHVQEYAASFFIPSLPAAAQI